MVLKFEIERNILRINVSHGFASLRFSIPKLITKGKRYDLFNPAQFEVLNEFIKRKGPEFSDNLYNKFNNFLISDISSRDKFIELLSSLLEGFSIEGIVETCVSLDTIVPPTGLKDVFDPSIASDTNGTRDGTYTKNQYYELIALSTIAKLIIGPISEYLAITPMPNELKTLILLEIAMETNNPIFDSDPWHKMLAILNNIYDKDSGVSTMNLIMKNGVTSEDIPIFGLSKLFFTVMVYDIPRNGVNSRNLITAFHNKASDLLSGNRNTTNLQIRKQTIGPDGKKQSVQESVGKTKTVTIGDEVSINFCYGGTVDLESFYFEAGVDHDFWKKHFTPGQNDITRWEDLITYMSDIISSNGVSSVTKRLCDLASSMTLVNEKNPYRGVIRPEAVYYLEGKEMATYMAISMYILLRYDFLDLARLIGSSMITYDDDGESVTAVAPLEPMDKKLCDEVMSIYPALPHMAINSIEDICTSAIGIYTTAIPFKGYTTYEVPTSIRNDICRFIIMRETGGQK